MTRAIYLMTQPPPDAAIVSGLRAARCEIVETCSITETYALIKAADVDHTCIVLICELDAGAIPLLMLIHDGQGAWEPGSVGATLPHPLTPPPRLFSSHSPLPPTMIFDRQGSDVRAVIRAFQFGVSYYLLASIPEDDRELAARLLVERSHAYALVAGAAGDNALTSSRTSTATASAGSAIVAYSAPPAGAFRWDAARNMIRCGDLSIHISPTEGRIFDLLTRSRGTIISLDDLIHHALQEPSASLEASVDRIRSHVMKLRRKLDAHPATANHIINVRGTGYLFM